MAFLATSHEISGNLGNLHIRQDLLTNTVTIYFRNWEQWDVDVAQVRISENLIHFVQPDGEIVGIKVFGGEN